MADLQMRCFFYIPKPAYRDFSRTAGNSQQLIAKVTGARKFATTYEM